MHNDNLPGETEPNPGTFLFGSKEWNEYTVDNFIWDTSAVIPDENGNLVSG